MTVLWYNNLNVMRSYQTLDVWKTGMQLVKDIYLITKNDPKEELFALTSQAKRAAVSIPSTIAEGMGRQYKKDTIHFLHISSGSLYELETHLNISMMINTLEEDAFRKVLLLVDDVVKLLNGLIKYTENAGLK